MTVQLREGSSVQTFANGAAALRTLMEREGSPYVSGSLSADGTTITADDGAGKVDKFALTELRDEADEESECLSMYRIVEALVAEGIPALVEQTGGGVATIFAGEPTDGRYLAVAGPGFFLLPGDDPRNAYADRQDFSVSADDDGESPSVTYASEALAVAAIRALVRPEAKILPTFKGYDAIETDDICDECERQAPVVYDAPRGRVRTGERQVCAPCLDSHRYPRRPIPEVLHRHADGTEHRHSSYGFTIGGQIRLDDNGTEEHAHGTISLGGGESNPDRTGLPVWNERDGDLSPKGGPIKNVEEGGRRMTYGPEQSNIGAFIRDGRGRLFEIIDETPDGRYVVVQDGYGDSQIDLDEGYEIVE